MQALERALRASEKSRKLSAELITARMTEMNLIKIRVTVGSPLFGKRICSTHDQGWAASEEARLEREMMGSMIAGDVELRAAWQRCENAWLSIGVNFHASIDAAITASNRFGSCRT